MILSEEELVYNYMIGNEEALSFLFSLYEKKVGPFLNKHDYVFNTAGMNEKNDIFPGYIDKKKALHEEKLNNLLEEKTFSLEKL